jgi:hypothetical protein
MLGYRIPWGGSQAAELMLKLAQLKYPGFPTKVTLPQATVSLSHMPHDHQSSRGVDDG